MTIGTSVEAIGIGSRFDLCGNDYLADSYPFMAEARGATPVFPQDAFDDEARLISVVADRDATLDLGPGVTGLPRKLQQGRRRAPSSLGALPAAQTAGEVVHEGGRRVLHGGAVDVARRLAAGALDFRPWEAAVDGLVDGRRRIDRFAIGPHPLVP